MKTVTYAVLANWAIKSDDCRTKDLLGIVHKGSLYQKSRERERERRGAERERERGGDRERARGGFSWHTGILELMVIFGDQ